VLESLVEAEWSQGKTVPFANDCMQAFGCGCNIAGTLFPRLSSFMLFGFGVGASPSAAIAQRKER